MDTLTLKSDMRIMVGSEHRRRIKKGERLVVVDSIPQTMFVDVHERQSDNNHGQTLEQIRSRGGFDPVEMLAVFGMVPFKAVASVTEETAHRLLYAMVATHNRGMRVAEAARAATPTPEKTHG